MYLLLFDFFFFSVPSQDRYFKRYFLIPRLPGLLWRTEGFAKDVFASRFLCLDQIRTHFSTVLGIDWLSGYKVVCFVKRNCTSIQEVLFIVGGKHNSPLLGCRRMLSPMQPTNSWKCITEWSDEKESYFLFFIFPLAFSFGSLIPESVGIMMTSFGLLFPFEFMCVCTHTKIYVGICVRNSRKAFLCLYSKAVENPGRRRCFHAQFNKHNLLRCMSENIGLKVAALSIAENWYLFTLKYLSMICWKYKVIKFPLISKE